MAQASGDAGLAQLERTLVNNPETSGAITGRYAAQRAARLKAVQDIAGTDAHYAGIKDGRRVFAQQDYDAAMSAGIDPHAAESMAPQIAALMERPSIQAAQKEAIKLAKEKNYDINDFGSIEGLDWLKKGLDNLVSKAGSPGSSIGKEELRAITRTKQDLMSVIEEVSPGYKAANDAYSKMSSQVNSMDAARALLDRMQSPLARAGASGRELKNEYARALEQATESVKKSTGQNRALSDVMPAGDVSTLQNVARDMGRAANAEEMGRAVGSNTAQNFASQNLLRRTLGPLGLPESWSEAGILQGLMAPINIAHRALGTDAAVKGLLANASADPAVALQLMMLARQKPGLLRSGYDSASPLLPSGSLGLLSDFSQK